MPAFRVLPATVMQGSSPVNRWLLSPLLLCAVTVRQRPRFCRQGETPSPQTENAGWKTQASLLSGRQTRVLCPSSEWFQPHVGA
jgi:hypothetical protein